MTAHAARSTIDTLRPLVTTLANGLRVVTAHLPAAHRVAVLATLRVGSRYETEATNGLSHLLEHMLYRGIPGHPTAHEQALAFETLGGTLVAATGSDSGTMAVSCPPENFAPTVDLLARAFREPLFGGLEVEKRIVREEILEDLDEDGTLIDDHDLLRATAFEGHPLGFPVIGTVRHVDSFDVPLLRAHHARHYVGAGTVIAIAGPMDPEEAARAVEAHFGAVPAGDLHQVTPPDPQPAPRLRIVQSSSSQTSVRIAFRGAGIHHPSEPATELLLRLLDDGNSTRLYSRLCDERGLAYDVGAGYDAADDVGLFDVSCDVAHSETATVFGEIVDVLTKLRDEGPTQAELDKAKARHRFSLDDMLDDASLLSDYLADASLRGYAASPADRRDRLDAVTAEAVQSAARALFRAENLTAVVVGRPAKRAQVAIGRMVSGFR